MAATQQLPVGDRAVLALSPHLDDAWLSAAALLGSTRCEVWTVFAGQPDPPQQTAWDLASGFPNSRATMTARLAEDTAAFEGSAHQVRRLPLLEAGYAEPSRRRDQAAALRQELDAWLGAHPDGILAAPVGAGVHVKEAAWERARERLRRPAEATSIEDAEDGATAAATRCEAASPALPPAVGRAAAATFVRRVMHADHQRRRRNAQRRGMAANPDHLLVRDVALQAAAGTPGVDVLLWEDLPYLWHERGAARVPRLQRTGPFSAETIEVAVDVEEKFSRVSCYASQLRILDPKRRRLCSSAGLPASETYWMLRRRPA